jgi:hypothetical protein
MTESTLHPSKWTSFNRNGPKGGLVPLKAAQLPASKKANKNNGQNWTVCCFV